MAPNDEVAIYKCCKNKELKTYVCIKCGAAYHFGCKERSLREAQFIRGALINCCREELDDESETGISAENERTLRELIEAKNQTIEDKMVIIHIKSELIEELKSKIQILEDKIVNITSKNHKGNLPSNPNAGGSYMARPRYHSQNVEFSLKPAPPPRALRASAWVVIITL